MRGENRRAQYGFAVIEGAGLKSYHSVVVEKNTAGEKLWSDQVNAMS